MAIIQLADKPTLDEVKEKVMQASTAAELQKLKDEISTELNNHLVALQNSIPVSFVKSVQRGMISPLNNTNHVITHVMVDLNKSIIILNCSPSGYTVMPSLIGSRTETSFTLLSYNGISNQAISWELIEFI